MVATTELSVTANACNCSAAAWLWPSANELAVLGIGAAGGHYRPIALLLFALGMGLAGTTVVVERLR